VGSCSGTYGNKRSTTRGCPSAVAICTAVSPATSGWHTAETSAARRSGLRASPFIHSNARVSSAKAFGRECLPASSSGCRVAALRRSSSIQKGSDSLLVHPAYRPQAS
jgi:hypothetical protein